MNPLNLKQRKRSTIHPISAFIGTPPVGSSDVGVQSFNDVWYLIFGDARHPVGLSVAAFALSDLRGDTCSLEA